jgi:hypothetical protein
MYLNARISPRQAEKEALTAASTALARQHKPFVGGRRPRKRGGEDEDEATDNINGNRT